MQLISSVSGGVDRRDPPLRERNSGPCCRTRPPSPPPGFTAETRTEDGPSRCSRPLRPARAVRVRPRTVRDTREAGPGPPRTPRRVARCSSVPTSPTLPPWPERAAAEGGSSPPLEHTRPICVRRRLAVPGVALDSTPRPEIVGAGASSAQGASRRLPLESATVIVGFHGSYCTTCVDWPDGESRPAHRGRTES